MILKGIDLYNFMIFGGNHSVKLHPKVNLVVGKNESGKSILCIDAFKYVFLKRIRFKKIENVINNKTDKDDHGFASVICTIDDVDMTFKRYLQHAKYKNNLCIVSDTDSICVNGVESFANVKNTPIQNFLKNMNIDLDFFELVSIYNPSKEIIMEKKTILDLLSVNFTNILSIFDVIYRTFDSEVTYIQNEISNLETELGDLTRSHIVTDEISTLQDENRRISSKLVEFKSKKSELSDALGKLSTYSGELNSTILEDNKALQKMMVFYKSGVCNTCGRPFDQEEQKEVLVSQIKEKRDNIISCNEKLTNLSTRIAQLRETIKKLESNIWTLLDRSKDNEKKMVNNDAKIETLKGLVKQKKSQLDIIEGNILEFKKYYDDVFSQDDLNSYIRNKIYSFEQVYKEIYNILTQQSVDVKLNLNRYEEPEFGEFFYSGLSTSKKRITYLSMMLALHIFCDIKLNFLILDEFFDVFDFEHMVKVLEIIFSNPYFKDLQFVITSNNDDLIGLIKDYNINLINLIDYTK